MTGRVPLGVVVPAHDEADLLDGCLGSLGRAVDAVADRADVRVLVVLDACTDATGAVARAHGVATTAVPFRRVGAARAAGCAALLADVGSPRWLATTDADSRVDPDWLAVQLDAEAAGWDAVVGTVRVTDWTARDPVVEHRYRQGYDARVRGDDHRHVHGANLGVRAARYRAVGGFPARPSGEDVALVAALERSGARVRFTRTSCVATSPRRDGRAPAGFAAHLADLESDLVAGAGPRAGR